MDNILSYSVVEASVIEELKNNGTLEIYNWKVYNEDDTFYIFTDRDIDIGVVECSFTEDKVAFIEMIEVFLKYRKKSYGKRIVKILQEKYCSWRCVPIPESKQLFRSMGFVPDIQNHQFWIWNK